MDTKAYANISYVGIATAFNAGLGFLFLTAVARYFSIEDFGKYALLVSLLVSLSKLLDFGTTSLYVAKSITENTNYKDIFVSSKVYLFLLSLPIFIGALVLLNLADFQTVFIFTLGMIFYGVNYTLFALFQKVQNYTALILLNGIPALIKGLFAFLLFFNFVRLSVPQAFSVFSYSLACGFVVYFLLPAAYKTFNLLDFGQAKKFLAESISPGIAQLINDGFSAIGNSIAKIVSNFTGVGIYSLADKIASVFVFVSFSIFTVLLPKNSERKKNNKGYDFTETLLLSTGVFVLAGIIAITGKYLVPWFFADKFNSSLPILNILVFSSAVISINSFLENYFYVEAKTNYLPAISITRLGFFIIFAGLLLPSFNMVGLALAQLISSIVGISLTVSLILKKSTA